jgi:hypothetical protein
MPSHASFKWKKEKKMLVNVKYLNDPSIYEYKIGHCTISSWRLGDLGDREWVSNVGVVWLKHDIDRPEVAR